MRLSVIIVGLAVLMPSAAMAADVPALVDAPVIMPAADGHWSGFYAGIQGGFAGHEDFVADPAYDPLPLTGTIEFSGAALGVHLGFDHQMDSLVFGAVGDVEWLDGEGTVGPLDGGFSTYGYAAANWQSSMRLRLGYAVDTLLFYGTAGIAFANYDFDFESSGGTAFGMGDQFNETLTGYTVGAGVAVATDLGIELFADYRYSDFGTVSSTITNCCAPPPNSQEHSVSSHTVRVGASLRF